MSQQRGQPRAHDTHIERRRLVSPDHTHKVERILESIDDGLKGVVQGRRPDVRETPRAGMVQIGKATVEQRAHGVERDAGMEVGLEESLGVRCALGWVEAVDVVASVQSSRASVR